MANGEALGFLRQPNLRGLRHRAGAASRIAAERRSRVRGAAGIPLLIALPGALVLLLLLTFIFFEGRKMYWDYRVKEMCERDGGVHVYETARLPAEVFDQYAKKNWVLPDKTHVKPTDEYYVETERHYYRRGDPEVSRRQYQIIRGSDGKVLGEMIRYGRGGGDIPGPWHSSSFTCPRPTKGPYLEPSIFQRRTSNE